MAKQNPKSKSEQFNNPSPRVQHNTPQQNKQRQVNFQKTQESEYYDNNDRGALFVNERRQNEKQPTLSGNININGVDMWLSAWSKVDESGENYLSLATTDKEDDSIHHNGKLQVNTNKSDKTHPDMRGYLQVDGNKISLAAWYHTDKNKNKYVSISISESGNFDENTELMPWEF